MLADSTPTTLGSSNIGSGGGTQNVITTTAPVPAGNLVVVAAVSVASPFEGISSVSDGTNTYTAGVTQTYNASGLDDAVLYYHYYTSSLASGSSITVTWAGVVTSAAAVSAQFTSVVPVSPFDSVASSSGSGASTTPSKATGVLAKTSEIVFGALAWTNPGSANYTENSPFTNLYNNVANSSARLSLGYYIARGTAAVTYAPTIAALSPFGIIVAPFTLIDDSGSGMTIFKPNWPQNRQRWA